MVAVTISTAPRRSSLGGRSWRGSDLSARPEIANAGSPSGRLIQKMSDPCKCSANTPPGTGPAIEARGG
jgi:hypothetical protein